MFDFKECTRCGAYFLGERPLESELERVYFVGYGPHQSMGTTGKAPPAHVLARAVAPPLRVVGLALGLTPGIRLSRALDRVYAPETSGETLLDYGCGAPVFLDRARKLGWNTIGVDFTADVIESVRASGHAAYFAGDEFEADVRDESVACVRMNHVVEHLPEPAPVLERIRSKMRRGGRLHIATPNPASVGSRLFGRHWWGLECPRHFLLYRGRVLRGLLEQTGFHVERIVHEAAAKDLARSWGIRLSAHGRMAPDRIGALAHDRVRLSLFAPAASLTALVSAADRYHVFARA